MTVLLLGLSLGVLPCGAEDAGFTAPMVIYTRFQNDPPAAVISSVRRELAAIMRPTGIRFEWRPVPIFGPSEVAVELAVITFKGRCEFTGISPRPSTTQVLGLTHVSQGMIMPYSEIDCDAIHKLIQRDLMAERPDRRNQIYARAVARVLAHELYHILANTAKHGSCGIGKPTFRVSDLLADDFHFEPRDVIALQDGEMIANLKKSANAGRSTAVTAGADAESGH